MLGGPQRRGPGARDSGADADGFDRGAAPILNGARPRRVLIVAHIPSHVTELERLARRLSQAGDDVHFRFLPFEGWRAAADGLVQAGVACLDSQGRAYSPESDGDVASDARGRRPPLWWRVPRYLFFSLPRQLARRLLAELVQRFREHPLVAYATQLQARVRELRAARRLLAQVHPDVIVMAEDNVEFDTAALVRAGHEQKIPSVIVPFTIATALEPAESYKHFATHGMRRLTNRLFARGHPQWIYVHHGRPLLRLPAAHALVLERLGLAPPLPWAHNSGFADRIAVESEVMRRHYLEQGIPEQQLTLTGAPSDDALTAGLARAAQDRRRLLTSLGADEQATIVLCAFPPDQTNSRRTEGEFTSYAELTHAWLECLAELDGCAVLVTLHPRTRATGLPAAVPSVLSLRAEDTLSLVAMSDVFVASASATIRWALACGRPIVNYDVYRYSYDDFADVPSVLTVRNLQEFRRALARLALDPSQRKELALQGNRGAPSWGRLDGCSSDRIRRLLHEINQEGRCTRR